MLVENAYYLDKYIVEMLFIHRKYTPNQLGFGGCLWISYRGGGCLFGASLVAMRKWAQRLWMTLRFDDLWFSGTI